MQRINYQNFWHSKITFAYTHFCRNELEYIEHFCVLQPAWFVQSMMPYSCYWISLSKLKKKNLVARYFFPWMNWISHPLWEKTRSFLDARNLKFKNRWRIFLCWSRSTSMFHGNMSAKKFQIMHNMVFNAFTHIYCECVTKSNAAYDIMNFSIEAVNEI